MAGKPSRECWRTRAERFLASDMSVYEWCAVNRISTSAMFRHLGDFADTEPEIFGGPQNIVDRSQARWVTKTRENMRAATALSAPAPRMQAPAFVRLDDALAVPVEAEPAPPAPGRDEAPAPVTVALNGAVVSVPEGCTGSHLRLVLEAVASL